MNDVFETAKINQYQSLMTPSMMEKPHKPDLIFPHLAPMAYCTVR